MSNPFEKGKIWHNILKLAHGGEEIGKVMEMKVRFYFIVNLFKKTAMVHVEGCSHVNSHDPAARTTKLAGPFKNYDNLVIGYHMCNIPSDQAKFCKHCLPETHFPDNWDDDSVQDICKKVTKVRDVKNIVRGIAEATDTSFDLGVTS